VIEGTADTPQSVILYDPAGRRRAETDLKALQEATFLPTGSTPPRRVRPGGAGQRQLDPPPADAGGGGRAAHRHRPARGAHPGQPYDADYLAHAAVLFLSGESLRASRGLRLPHPGTGRPEIIGSASAATAPWWHPGAPAHPGAGTGAAPVVSTIGAGDALLAGFLHFHARDGDPVGAMRRAVTFAAWKVGEASASAGFLGEAEVERLSR